MGSHCKNGGLDCTGVPGYGYCCSACKEENRQREIEYYQRKEVEKTTKLKNIDEFIKASLSIFELAALFNRDTDEVWAAAKKEFFDAYEKLTGQKLW